MIYLPTQLQNLECRNKKGKPYLPNRSVLNIATLFRINSHVSNEDYGIYSFDDWHRTCWQSHADFLVFFSILISDEVLPT